MTKTNFIQVDPDSQHFTKIEQIIYHLKWHSELTKEDIELLVNILERTKAMGYELKKTKKEKKK